jgi:putative MATE family efflux protein
MIVLSGAPFFMVALTCECVMRAAGDTRTPLLIDLTAIGLNAVLAPFLIYGIGPFPRLEVAGAAIATVCAQVVMVILYLAIAIRGHRAFPFAVRAPGAPVRALGMARVGAPGALIGLMFSVVYIAFARSASRYGAAAMAVVGIVSRIEALEFITSVAIGTAGAALVGQNLGAGRPDRATTVVRTGNLWNLAVTCSLTILFWTVPGAFLGLFSRDPGVLALGVPYLRVIAFCLVLNGAEIVTAESVIGSGHTRTLSLIFTTFSLARIPLAFLVPAWTGTGVLGVAWVITVTCLIRAAVILAWAARGTWKRGLKTELQGAEPTVLAP